MRYWRKDIETIKDYFIEYEDTADLIISLEESLEESVNSESDTIQNAAKTLIAESIPSSDNKLKERIGMYLKHLNKK